jgi:hypothetical protein
MSREQQTGLVMVKPHAFSATLDPLVSDIINGGKTSERLDEHDPLRIFIGRVETRPAVIRDLRTCTVGETLLKVFYEDKQDRRYFPIIMERYLGRVAFLPYVFHGSTQEMPQFYEALKGSAETFNSEGLTVSQAAGVRGLLSRPYMAVDDSDLLLDDEAYRNKCLPMIDNVFHVCDSQEQNEEALRLLGITEG